MKTYRILVVLFTLTVCLRLSPTTANAQAKGKYVCAERDPQSLCNAGNTCSASGPCTVDIKREGMNSATATPGFPNAKKNSLFCVKPGTTVTFQTSSKGTGFIVDPGPSSPFDPADTIIGGAQKPVQVTAKRPGCFKYSVGACYSGATYGMCGSGAAEAIVMTAGSK
jgi:plastocyanin